MNDYEKAEFLRQMQEQAANVRVHEEVDEDFKFGEHTYRITGYNRDWNPLSGHTPPEGTVWELRTEFEHYDGTKSEITGAGSSKEEAIRGLVFMMGVKTAADIMACSIKR